MRNHFSFGVRRYLAPELFSSYILWLFDVQMHHLKSGDEPSSQLVQTLAFGRSKRQQPLVRCRFFHLRKNPLVEGSECPEARGRYRLLNLTERHCSS